MASIDTDPDDRYRDARYRYDDALSALEGLSDLLDAIYCTGRDLHCVRTETLASLLRVVHREIAANGGEQ